MVLAGIVILVMRSVRRRWTRNRPVGARRRPQEGGGGQPERN